MSSHKLCEGQSKGFIIDDIDLFVLRHQGRVLAYLNSCPHRQVPLEFLPDQFLDEDKQFIQCATHGALFQIDSGKCLVGPCRGKHLQPVPFELVDGVVSIAEALLRRPSAI